MVETTSRPSHPGERSSQPSVLLVINADTSIQPAIPTDRRLERLADYTTLKTTLDGHILDWNDLQTSRWSRLLARLAGKGVALAALAFTRRQRYPVLYCDSENNGLVLAALLKLTRSKKPLVMLGHWITPPKKALLLKTLRLHTHIHKLLLHSTAQLDHARDHLGFPPSRLALLPYQVDTEFWKAENATATPDDLTASPSRPYICTAGLEFRDYPTLLEAVRGLDLDLKIGAASHWSKRKASDLDPGHLPSNVTVRSYNYPQLRDLYAGCRFVVVPLYDVDFQAGITLILEAMAMGKAVIVTRSLGQGDTIADRRRQTRRDPLRPTTGHFTHLFDRPDLSGQTGFYVTPHDPAELRRVIQFLLNQPALTAEVGHRARQVVENLMSVELFADRIRQVIEEASRSTNSTG